MTVQWVKGVFSVNGARSVVYSGKRMHLDPYLIPYTKINFRWTLALNAKDNAIKLLEENKSIVSGK